MKKEITYDKDKKINLGLTSEYKKEHKKAAIIFSIISCLLLLICILINWEDEEKLVIYLFLVLSIITAIYCLLSINEKVEIENGVITRTNCFKKKKIIGNISDIKYFTTVENEAVVYKENYKKMFSFRYTISKTHKSFYKYLLDNHNDIIPIFKNKITCVICSFVILWVVATIFLLLYFFEKSILILCIFIPVILLIYYSWLNKPCLIVDDKKITYYGLFKTKEINLSDITKIKFQLNRYHQRMPSSSYHDIFIYNKRKLLLKVPTIKYEDMKRIVDKVKQYNIKIVRR